MEILFEDKRLFFIEFSIIQKKRPFEIKKIAIFSSLGLIFDLVVFFVCCIGVNSELGYLSPGEYEMHSDVTV